MNSWNRSTSYANDVKAPNLDIPSELQDLAYDVASGEVEAHDWDIFFARTVSDFYRRTGYHIGFNGRSSGYDWLRMRLKEGGPNVTVENI